jgi:2-oxoglutarate ferredoxin oxidoreductase subunit alpha
MSRVLIKGTEALAEGAIRAGSRFFAGYPITPQTEVLEYLSTRMDEVGGSFVQSESELAAISMVYGAAAAGQRAFTSSSGPGFSLKHEGISYIASAELPAVIINVQRYGSGLGDIFQAQSDYWQTTKNGGHGDYRTIVYAPGSVQEMADFMGLAFDKAEEYLNPVVILTDGALAQMMEPVLLPPMKEHDPDKFCWSLKGKNKQPFRRVTSRSYYAQSYTAYDKYLKEKIQEIEDNEQRYESIETDDAEVILVAYGISSRICKDAVKTGREKGIKLGLIRPITLWPFPSEKFKNTSSKFKGFLTVEMSAFGQMTDDVAIASFMKDPIYSLATGNEVPDTNDILRYCNEIINGNAKEVYSNCQEQCLNY